MAGTPTTKIIKSLLQQSTVNYNLIALIATVAARAGIGDDDKEFVELLGVVQENTKEFIKSIEIAIATLEEEQHG